MSTDAHFWVKIGFKFQSMCKISNMSTSDPPVLLGQFQHWLLVENDCVTHAVRYCGSCKDYQNLNSFFAVVMGLSNIAVSRLSQTWEVQFVGCLAPPVYTCLLEIISYELHVNPLTPLLPYGYSYKASCARLSFVIFDIRAFWRSLSPQRQSARVSKITNDGLIRSGTGCFIDVPIWQQWASKAKRFTMRQWNIW